MKVVVIGVYAKSLVSFRGELLRTMASSGHQVLAMAPEDDPGVRRILKDMGVEFEAIPLDRSGLNPIRDLQTVVYLWRRLRRYGPDTVLVYAAKPVVYGLMASALARVPRRVAMITGVGSIMAGGTSRRRRVLSTVLRSLYRIALHRAHIVIFQNPDDERVFKAAGLIGPRQVSVRVNGSGVDLAHYAVAPLPPPPPVFIMMSRLIRDKGIFEFVEAARLVRSRDSRVRFVLIGPMDSNVSALSETDLLRLGREGHVDYLGTLDDVRPAIADAHVCVLPSYGEGTPRSVLEAMAMGRAIITTDVPGCRETVTDGLNGRLVAPRDAGALAAAMIELSGDPGLVEEMGLASRRIAESRYDVHLVNRTMLAAMGVTTE